MSGLYNIVHGENPFAPPLLAMLGITREAIPRYRDCWWDGEHICIHTRTGGGNREFYESEASCREHCAEYFQEGTMPPDGPWNEDLRALPGFVRDEDDSFDATYATFYFKAPDGPGAAAIMERVEPMTQSPGERWQRATAAINAGDVGDLKKALAPLISQIEKRLKDGD